MQIQRIVALAQGRTVVGCVIELGDEQRSPDQAAGKQWPMLPIEQERGPIEGNHQRCVARICQIAAVFNNSLSTRCAIPRVPSSRSGQAHVAAVATLIAAAST